MSLLTFSPADLSISVAGLIDITGFIDGSFLSIEKEVTPFVYQRAIDGGTSRTHTKDDNYKVMITITQTSPSNDILNALHGIDIATQVGKVPLLIRDKQGNTIFFSPSASIENYPTITYSKGMEGRQWTFRCPNGMLVVGGNGPRNLLLTALGLAPTASSLLGE